MKNIFLSVNTCLTLTLWLMAFAPSISFGQQITAFDPPAVPCNFSAAPTSSSIQIDGNLSEEDWTTAKVISGFLQHNPNQGARASFDTEVRILFDDQNMYVGVTAYDDPAGGKNLRVQNLVRDYEWTLNDAFGIAIDGFMDKRYAMSFEVTPYGNVRDLQVTDGINMNLDWNALWDVNTTINEDHWIAEIAIPWKSLRYREGTEEMGVVFMRNIRRLNEFTVTPEIPRVFTPYRMAYEAKLTNLETPKPSSNIQINPYLLAEAYQEKIESAGETVFGEKLGGEVKWVINPNTVLDVTLNTDFAQVEADRQFVNLDRVSLLFSEKRQFFLENAALFQANVTSFIQPFYSRRIGLDQAGSPIPIHGGVRFITQNEKYSIGVLGMSQKGTGISDGSQFGVLRYINYTGEQDRFGVMGTFRNDVGRGANNNEQNYTVTVDGHFRPSQRISIQGMVSASGDQAYGQGIASQMGFTYENNLLNTGWVGHYVYNYNPGIGFVRLNQNYFLSSGGIDFDWRPGWLPNNIRSLTPGVNSSLFFEHDLSDLIFGGVSLTPLSVIWQSGASLDYSLSPNWQRLHAPRTFARILVDRGRYQYYTHTLNYSSDFSNSFAAEASLSVGGYFDGRLQSIKGSARYSPNHHAELSLDYTWNGIRNLGIQSEDTDNHIWRVNSRFAINPSLIMNGFYQWINTTETSAWNIRFSWEYQPLSYVYLVFNSTRRDQNLFQPRAIKNQAIAKITLRRQF